jgi:hypothetical protein
MNKNTPKLDSLSILSLNVMTASKSMLIMAKEAFPTSNKILTNRAIVSVGRTT